MKLSWSNTFHTTAINITITELNINFLIHDHQRSHHMPHGHKINIGMREHIAIIFDTFSSWKAVIKDGVVTGHDL